MDRVLITGGSGLVGQRLTKLLVEKGYEVYILSRSKREDRAGVRYWQWSLEDNFIEEGALDVDHVIHLAGAGVADKRWTKERKQEIRDSRVFSSRLLAEKLKGNTRVKSFVGASAVGYYGSRGDQWLSEGDGPGEGYLSEICIEWEDETKAIQETCDCALAILRIGIVLSYKGGALPKLSMPAKLGIGAYLGDGSQYYPWIHIDDLCQMFIYAMDEGLNGVYNATAPEPVTNKNLVKTIAFVLKRPFIPAPGPAFILRIVMGEMATMLLNSQRTKSDAIRETGFAFEHTELDLALKDIFRRKI